MGVSVVVGLSVPMLALVVGPALALGSGVGSYRFGGAAENTETEFEWECVKESAARVRHESVCERRMSRGRWGPIDC